MVELGAANMVLAVIFSDQNELRILRAVMVCKESIPKALHTSLKGEKPLKGHKASESPEINKLPPRKEL